MPVKTDKRPPTTYTGLWLKKPNKRRPRPLADKRQVTLRIEWVHCLHLQISPSTNHTRHLSRQEQLWWWPVSGNKELGPEDAYWAGGDFQTWRPSLMFRRHCILFFLFFYIYERASYDLSRRHLLLICENITRAERFQFKQPAQNTDAHRTAPPLHPLHCALKGGSSLAL